MCIFVVLAIKSFVWVSLLFVVIETIFIHKFREHLLKLQAIFRRNRKYCRLGKRNVRLGKNKKKKPLPTLPGREGFCGLQRKKSILKGVIVVGAFSYYPRKLRLLPDGGGGATSFLSSTVPAMCLRWRTCTR
jgi:hypothetical protein